MNRVRVGIDIGNVIIAGGGADTTFFGEDFLMTPEIPGAFTAIATIAETCDVWIVSKCGQKIQDRSLAWLEARNFFEITGINREQVLFCRKRNQKVGIAEELGLSVFIDDREDIISSMEGIIAQPILFASWAAVEISS